MAAMNKLALMITVALLAFAGPVLASEGEPSSSGGSSSSRSQNEPELGANPGVELPALVVPMSANGGQAGYFYLTMALEVRGDGWSVREKVPLIQDHLVRWVYANPIPAGLSEEEALDILSAAVIDISNEIMGGPVVLGLVYRDVSTGF